MKHCRWVKMIWPQEGMSGKCKVGKGTRQSACNEQVPWPVVTVAIKIARRPAHYASSGVKLHFFRDWMKQTWSSSLFMLLRCIWFSFTVFPNLSSIEEPLIHFLTSQWTPTYKKFTGQKKLIAGSCSVANGWGSSVTIWNKQRQSTTQYNLKYELTKTKQADSWKHMGITPVLPTARQKFQIHHGIFGIFHGISIFLLLFPLFLAETKSRNTALWPS